MKQHFVFLSLFALFFLGACGTPAPAPVELENVVVTATSLPNYHGPRPELNPQMDWSPFPGHRTWEYRGVFTNVLVTSVEFRRIGSADIFTVKKINGQVCLEGKGQRACGRWEDVIDFKIEYVFKGTKEKPIFRWASNWYAKVFVK